MRMALGTVHGTMKVDMRACPGATSCISGCAGLAEAVGPVSAIIHRFQTKDSSVTADVWVGVAEAVRVKLLFGSERGWQHGHRRLCSTDVFHPPTDWNYVLRF